MPKPLVLSIAACLALSGCQLFHKSPAWDKVVRTRIPVPREGDVSRAYAEGLHRELQAGRIEHQVVTYQYRYRRGLREEATAERTAVIYRDPTHPEYPSWLKDETSHRPLWLPNGSLEKQLRFYTGHEVEIVNPGRSGEGKQIAAAPRPARARFIAKAPRAKLPPPVAEAPRPLDPAEARRDAQGADSATDREKMNALLRARGSAAKLPLR